MKAPEADQTQTARAYPLQWPAGWPKAKALEQGRFRTTLSAALKVLKDEVARLGGTSLVLSSNYSLGSERPADPGVCAYFILRGQSIAIPCDRWNKVEDNVKAIALTIEAMRGMERWGAKHMITAMFQGFKALPASARGPWEVLELDPRAATKEKIEEAFHRLAKERHPDKGGTGEAFAELAQARKTALSWLA